MTRITICDLCGRPITSENPTQYKYKIKKRWYSWGETGWERIEAHEACIEKLVKAKQRVCIPCKPTFPECKSCEYAHEGYPTLRDDRDMTASDLLRAIIGLDREDDKK